jgi:hypothetical protein
MSSAIEEETSLELGDTLYILGGRYDKLLGRIYYADDELIRILPNGVSDRLVDIPIVDDEFDPALGITDFYSVSKRTKPAFVAQIDAHVGQYVETFTDAGVPGPTYKVNAVDEPTDRITLGDEEGEEYEIAFDGKGIPRDQPFAILRPRDQTDTADEPVENAETAVSAAAEAEAAEEEEEITAALDAEITKSRAKPERLETQFAEIEEVSVAARLYPDSVQKSEMLRDLILLERPEAQSNPDVQRRINTLVEQFMSLRNSVIYYSKSGEPVAQLPTSFTTLSELLDTIAVPLVRPVMKVKRSLFLDHSPEDILRIQKGDPTQDPTELPDADVEIRYLSDVVQAVNEYVDTQMGGVGAMADAGALPQWYLSWETLNRQFNTSWVPYSSMESTSFQRDTEFLRAPLPETDTPVVDGLPNLQGADRDIPVSAEVVQKIHTSLLRGLGPRQVRLNPKDLAERRVESPEEGTIVNTLIFPLSEQAFLGSIRSGRIANDIAASMQPLQSLHDIVGRLEGIPDHATAGGILSIGEGGNTNGSIPIESWLVNQPLYPLGLGDAILELVNYGLSQTEFTTDQQEVLVKKIDMYRALVKQYIMELRAASEKAMTEIKVTANNFLSPEAYADMLGAIDGEPVLKAEEKLFDAATPNYKDSDIAMFAYLSSVSSDLLVAALAQTPFPLARERNRKVRDQFLAALGAALQKTLKREGAGDAPTPNRCPHVESYDQIMRVRDDTQRMQLFSKFVAKFKAGMDGDWVGCSVCKEHLVCDHEMILLQEYLHPREKATLHKELVLRFNGGQFAGKYICKNCGQPVSDLDFDQSIEYTDDGVPMSGRAVMSASDEQIDAQIDGIIDRVQTPSLEQEEAQFKTQTQKLAYQTARRIFDMVGIQPEQKAYKHVVERVEGEMMRQMSREDYKKMAGAKKVPDYDIIINRVLLCSTAVNCLIEIQTSIPGYVMRYKMEGCKAGFSGVPIGNEQDFTGMEYIACAVSRVNENIPPWSLTGLNRETEKKRAEVVLTLMKKVLASFLSSAAVQQQLSLKRAQLKELYGSVVYSEQLPEKIPARFTPVPYNVADEETAKGMIVPEAAGPAQVSRAWILQAHRNAKENGVYMKGERLSEATCCYTRIQEPGLFWREAAGAMAKLPLKTAPRGPIHSHLAIPFTPREIADLEGTIPADVIYKIFLNVCYTGPKTGLRHEVGYTNECMNCGFVFPESPYAVQASMPVSRDLIKKYNEELAGNITRDKVALETQQVKISETTFEEVVDASHKAFRVEPLKSPHLVAGMELFEKFRTLDPEPFEGWRAQITETIEKISQLPATADEVDIATAYGAISDVAAAVLEEFRERLGEERMNILKRVLESNPIQIVEVIRTYFLVTFQRLIYGFRHTTLKVRGTYDLGEGTADDINRILGSHLEHLVDLSKRVKGFTLAKMKWAQARLVDALAVLKDHIRTFYITGGDFGLKFITTALIGGILMDFINPNVIPPGPT